MKTTPKAILLITSFVVVGPLVPIAFQFHPSKGYFVVCVLGALAAYRPIYSYLLRHWRANAEVAHKAGITSTRIVIQSALLCVVALFGSSHAVGLALTVPFGSSVRESGIIISQWSQSASRRKSGCNNFTVKTSSGDFIKYCSKQYLGNGSFVHLRVRRSVFGYYAQ